MNNFQKTRFLTLLLIFIFSSCSYFDEEEDNILPGKRESLYVSGEEVILKANKRIKIDKPIPITSWSQQHQNERNHLFHFKSKPNLKLKKKIRLGNINLKKIEYITPPVFFGETIYYSGNEFHVFAKSIETDKLKWKLKLEQEKQENFPLVGGFFANEKELFFSTGLGNIYCVDINSGKIKWKKEFGVQFSRPPLVKNNKVFVVSDDNQFFAIDKNTGTIVWSHLGNIEELSIIGGSKPVLDNNIIVVTYSSGEIFAFNQNDGSIIWFDNISSGSFLSKTSINDIQSPLCIDENTIYVPTFSNKLLAYDLKTGKSKWDINLSSINPLVISGETIFVMDINGRLLSLEKKTGKLIWAVQLRVKKNNKEIVWSGPILSTNKLLIVSSDGLVLSLSPFTGKTLSKIKFEESFLSNPFHVGEDIYLISKQGTLYVLG